MTQSKRPLSPHLQVWRWTPTMTMSILHRATGCANVAGLLVLVWWLLAAANGPESYNFFMLFAGSLIGKLTFFGWTFSVFLHLLSGVRHLIMDTGQLLTIESSDKAVFFIMISAVVLTAATWIAVLGINQ